MRFSGWHRSEVSRQRRHGANLRHARALCAGSSCAQPGTSSVDSFALMRETGIVAVALRIGWTPFFSVEIASSSFYGLEFQDCP
jgi:hypothetical protein